MALDTAFFSLFPDLYEVGGPLINAREVDDEGDSDATPEKLSKEQAASVPRVPKDFDCLRFMIESFEKKCMPLSDYGLGHVKYLVEYCETKQTPDIVNKAMEMGDTCANLVV